MKNIEATVLKMHALRAMGVKVGRAVVIVDAFALVVDPDMIECEDGATVAALTFYDMAKAVTHGIVIKDVRLLEKTGGKSDYRAAPAS